MEALTLGAFQNFIEADDWIGSSPRAGHERPVTDGPVRNLRRPRAMAGAVAQTVALG